MLAKSCANPFTVVQNLDGPLGFRASHKDFS